MGKPAHSRALSDTQARAIGRNIRISPRKLNLVAQSIRGKKAEAALATLTFSRKRIAQDVKKILQSAIANAENNHDLDVDDLVVIEASVGKNLVMRRYQPRARGRSGQIEKPFSQITIVVEEKRRPINQEPAKSAAAAGAAKPAAKKGANPVARQAAKGTAKAPAARARKSKEKS